MIEDPGIILRVYYVDAKVHQKTLEKYLKPEKGVHKIVISTNFLESSGTIPVIRNLIDTGHQYTVRYNTDVGCCEHPSGWQRM